MLVKCFCFCIHVCWQSMVYDIGLIDVLLYFWDKMGIFCFKHIEKRKVFFNALSPRVPRNPFACECIITFYKTYVNGTREEEK